MTNATNVPLYFDWSFWAVVIAGIAVVFSQLPPIHTLLRRAKIEMELYSRMQLTHKVGNPNVHLHLILRNVGGRSVRIKGATITLKRDGNNIAVLPAQTYLQNPDDKAPVLFTSFVLKSKEDWAHTVIFLNYFSRTDEKKYRSAESLLKKDILAKTKLPENKDRLVEAERDHVCGFIDMFNEKFIWLPGIYELCITVETSDNRASTLKKHRFTLFESDSDELSRVKEVYKLGDGLYWDSGDYLGVTVQITEA